MVSPSVASSRGMQVDAAARSPRRRLLAARAGALACACAALWHGASFVGRPSLTRSLRAPLRAPLRAEPGAAPDKNRWRLGVGKAIDVLRRDTVALFGGEADAFDLSIFSEDIQIADARVPDFRLSGLATYERLLSTMHWSLKAAASTSRLEITSVTPPVNNEVYMRWRLHIWPRDPLEDARSFFGNLGAISLGSASKFRKRGMGMPFIFEGYSRYEFDPWTAEIVKHTIDITNPPTFLSDLIRQYAPTNAWMTPTAQGLGVPMRYSGVPTVLTEPAAGPPAPPMGASAKVGALAGSTVLASATRQAVGAAAALGRGRTSRRAGWMGMPQMGCEDDFECNDGKANYPLQCCSLPLVGNFCCEPDDFEPATEMPAYVPLPVPIDERNAGPRY
jgi:hypothetical protein